MLACLPSAALADVCAILYPQWDGTPITMLQEVFRQLTNPVTALIVALAVTLILQKRAIFALLGVALVVIYPLVLLDPLFLDDDRWAAHQQGCIGNQELWWATLFAVALFGLYRTGRIFMRIGA